MHKLKRIYPVLIVLLAISCLKDTTFNDLTPHTEQRIIGEGFFTNTLEIQQFKFTLSTDFGSNKTVYTNEVSLSVTTPTETISYSNVANGKFESDVPFKGIYGEDYIIKFSFGNHTHSVVTTMPYPLTYSDIHFQEVDTASNFGSPFELELNVNSPIDQYLKFNLFVNQYNALGGINDSIWEKINLPIYRIITLSAGDNTVTLPVNTIDGLDIYQNTHLKLELEVLSEQVATYLFKLQDFTTGQSNNPESNPNPPYYYSNDAYGLGYGTVIDSVLHTY